MARVCRKVRILGITARDREDIIRVVKRAMHYFPNSHLGDVTPREDMRSAFAMIRREMVDFDASLSVALERFDDDINRYKDM
jgi:hypothetical protein